ncbi:D-2-hydroxyacid dehydrogenase [bacterium]|nr:D-2-hydroxyacid dehydrogenase [bacterium]
MVRPGLKVLLMYPPHAEHLDQLKAVAPETEWRVASDEPSAARMIADADAVLGNRYFLQSLPYAQNLRWMQSNSMGTDIILEGCADRPEIDITSARGVYDKELAEHTLAMTLALLRGLPELRDAQKKSEWKRCTLRCLSDQCVMILGWGGVGQSIAERIRAFNSEIIGVRLNHPGKPVRLLNGTLVCGPDHWKSMLSHVNILIMALPKTKHTYHIVSGDELCALPKNSHIINIGRGGTLNETALKTALDYGNIAAAALDVFETEPLPTDHWIWSDPRILLTPHVGRSIEPAPHKWEPLFVENVRRFYHELPLLNMVDRNLGY